MTILLLLSALIGSAQNQDEQLANQFYTTGEFQKASDYYEKLLNKNQSSMYFYDNLLSCYLKLNQGDQARSLAKKQARRFDRNYFYKVDQGYIAKITGKTTEADKIFDELIDKLPLQIPAMNDLASAFLKRNEKQRAIATYQKGRSLLKNDHAFCIELAGLYAETDQKENMVAEYLNLLEVDPDQKESVQGYLQNYLQTAAEFDICKVALNKKIRQNSNQLVFSEMLVWLYVQRQDFANALVQVRALDKRLKEDGRRLVELAFLADANRKYDDAIAIYKQVELLGENKPYYTLAKSGVVEVSGKKLLSGSYTQQELLNLQVNYKELIGYFGASAGTANLILGLARLQTYYLHDYTSALKNYQELVSMTDLEKHAKANAKLEMGDLYLVSGEVWEALLVYGQVDKDFLEDPIGQEAKFRSAQLSYYLGEFDWAKTQLDVLKTATTQLISNNAMELSLLIQENLQDSDEAPLKLFANADLMIRQNKLQEAERLLDSLERSFPKHTLADDILFKKAQIAESRKDYQKAVLLYKQIGKEHSAGLLADNALFQLAQLYQFQMNEPNLAKESYEKLINDYAGSFFTTEARKQFRLLRGDHLNE